jgi:hypothetical protein
MTHPPFAALKLSALLVLAALALTIVGTLWSRGLAHDAALALQQQHAARAEVQQKLSHSRQQQQRIQHHQADYQALAARGFFAAEDRLAWIEAAQHANRDARLYGLNYRLAPRTAAPATLAQGLPLAYTSMTLTLPLLVETDLDRFLSALKTRAPGIMRVQHCRLARPGDAAFAAVNQPQLEAECELHWYTLMTDHKAQP